MYEDFAVQSAPTSSSTVLTVWGVIMFLLLGFYFAFMQYRIAHRTGPSADAWWAFIPVMNTLLLVRMADKPIHWLVYLLIPGVNIIAFFMLWIEVARNAGVSGVWGFLALIPIINLLALFVMAYSSQPYVYKDYDDTPPPPRPRAERRIIQ